MVAGLPVAVALEHPRRAALYGVVRAEPGQGLRELARTLGNPVGTTRHHLRMLVRCGLLRAERRGRLLSFLPTGERRSPELLAMLHDPELRLLLDAIAEEGEISQVDLGVRFAGVPRTTLHHRLRRLVEVGAVKTARDGRRINYEYAQAGLLQESRRGFAE